MKTICLSLLVASLLPIVGTAAAEKTTENKNVTIIRGASVADGKSEVTEKLLEECVVSLPAPQDLEPVVTSHAQFLKEVNGDPAKNEFVKFYNATLEINYLIHQKVVIVVTTSSVQGQEPVMKVMDKTLQQSKKFESSESDGDLFAGRSRRQYYFSTAEGARNDVKHRAEAWLKQQSAVVCPHAK